MEAWRKAEELLNLANCLFVIQRGGLSWKLKVRPKIEDDEGEERILGRAMKYFCNASQVFYDEHPYQFYTPTEWHIDEFLMLDIIPMEFYKCIASGKFFCEDMMEENRQESSTSV